ncbi:hypothetical protein ACM66B_002736 [Microbotryomycetes sp. NB124-2]
MSKRQLETIVIDDDEDDQVAAAVARQDDDGELEFQRELERAIELSRQEAAAACHSQPCRSTATASGSVSASQSRAEMEQARLERQRQREASGAEQTSTSAVRSTKRPRVATMADVANAEPSTSGNGSVGNGSNNASSSFNATASTSASNNRRFWSGKLMRVHNKNVSAPDTLRFEQVINKGAGLKRAVVGAFVLEPGWVASHFDNETPLLLIMPAGDGTPEARHGQVSEAIKPNTFVSHPASVKFDWGQSLMHTKIIILYYEDFCRIAVPTANAVDYDWDTIDNSMYIQDFPRRQAAPKDAPRTNPTNTQFTTKLLDVLKTLHVPLPWVVPFIDYDFSAAKDVRLVYSSPGLWEGWEAMEQGGGHPFVAKQVQNLGMIHQNDKQSWSFEAQGSSVGNYTNNWLSQISQSFSGVHPQRYYTKAAPVPVGAPKVCKSVKVVYPTENEVMGSWGGTGHGGTIFCPDKAWDTARKMGGLFHKCVSKRERVTMHTKTVVALNTVANQGYIYVGSHNFSLAAWGVLQTSKKTGQPQLFVRNYELGVIIPITASDTQELQRRASELASFRRPIEPYGPNDKPWMQQHHTLQHHD